jgi:hypothetical protein
MARSGSPLGTSRTGACLGRLSLIIERAVPADPIGVSGITTHHKGERPI